jgi:hypothetical protein
MPDDVVVGGGAMRPSGRRQSHCLAEARRSHIWLEASLKSGAFLERKSDIGIRNASETHFQIAMQRIEHIVHNLVMDTKPLPRYPIPCEIDGKTHKRTYCVARMISITFWLTKLI